MGFKPRPESVDGALDAPGAIRKSMEDGKP
jgi:hypothetical protein